MMAFGVLDLLLLTVITTVTAFIPIFFSMRWAIKSQIKRQIMNLPKLLEEPEVEVAMKKALLKILGLTSGDFSKSLGLEMSKQIKPLIMKVLNDRLDKVGVTMTNSLKGLFGQLVKNFKGELLGKGKPSQGGKKGAVGSAISDIQGLTGKIDQIVGLFRGGQAPPKARPL